MAANKKISSTKPDFATLGGLVLAIGGILGGLLMEGGNVKDVSQVTAAIIVLAGTIGAVMVTTPMNVLLRAGKKLSQVFFQTSHSPEVVIEEIIAYATKARREGIVALEQEANAVQDPFLRKALNLAVDGNDLQQIRKIMELELTMMEHHGEAEAKVFEVAGGYSPTIGIIGAVLGLIQVMKHLADIDEVGRGIAVAFVATVYGVAAANLLFLPAGNKLKVRLHEAIQLRELMLEGVIAMVEGMNPKLVRSKLEAYLDKKTKSSKEQATQSDKAGSKPPVAA
jgi:chemotaxis protein MotA